MKFKLSFSFFLTRFPIDFARLDRRCDSWPNQRWRLHRILETRWHSVPFKLPQFGASTQRLSGYQLSTCRSWWFLRCARLFTSRQSPSSSSTSRSKLLLSMPSCWRLGTCWSSCSSLRMRNRFLSTCRWNTLCPSRRMVAWLQSASGEMAGYHSEPRSVQSWMRNMRWWQRHSRSWRSTYHSFTTSHTTTRW